MKKLFALVLALCMLCGCAAMAENDINWEDVAPLLEESGVTGDFYTFDDVDVEIFVPAGMILEELPDDSYIGYFVDEDEDSNDAIAVFYVDADGMDLETYAAALADPEVGATEIEMGTVNGLECVTYEVPANGTINVAFATEDGYILEVVCGPVSSEEEKIAAGFIMASIQPAE